MRTVSDLFIALSKIPADTPIFVADSEIGVGTVSMRIESVSLEVWRKYEHMYPHELTGEVETRDDIPPDSQRVDALVLRPSR